MSNEAEPATSSTSKHYDLNRRYSAVGDKNVWVEFTALARDYNAVNLGQGFPDYQSVPYMNEKVAEVLAEANPLMHQYTRSPVKCQLTRVSHNEMEILILKLNLKKGHLRLANAIAKCYSNPKFMDREINPLNEVLVSVGAYGCLYNALTSFLEEGDEVNIAHFMKLEGPSSIPRVLLRRAITWLKFRISKPTSYSDIFSFSRTICHKKVIYFYG
jgi:kynurenine--oxoglutarate transaminase/cysteine-S-conjugate beta-lyase/glutamine--phenylpyruvate transaminase